MAEEYLELMEGMDKNLPRPHKRHYSADVSLFEIRSYRLTADTCQRLNEEAAERNRILDEQPNAAFMVMVDKYERNCFNMETLQREPMQSCPDQARHYELHFNRMLHLSVACPTCWSLQRNSTKKKTQKDFCTAKKSEN